MINRLGFTFQNGPAVDTYSGESKRAFFVRFGDEEGTHRDIYHEDSLLIHRLLLFFCVLCSLPIYHPYNQGYSRLKKKDARGISKSLYL